MLWCTLRCKIVKGRLEVMISILDLRNRLNNRLVELKPEHDDSIVGFNEAWDIVTKVFDETPIPPTEIAYEAEKQRLWDTFSKLVKELLVEVERRRVAEIEADMLRARLQPYLDIEANISKILEGLHIQPADWGLPRG